jgi:hypothetical protein
MYTVALFLSTGISHFISEGKKHFIQAGDFTQYEAIAQRKTKNKKQ